MASGERTRTTAQAAAQGLRVFVAGIPWSVSEEVLKRDFAECGVVEDLFLLRDAEGNSRGRCFITFRDKKAVKAALEYDSTDYAGRTIYVKIAQDKPKGFEAAKSQLDNKAKEESFPAEKPEGCVSLCLKNLGEATEADVRKFLRKCSVQAVRIVFDRDTGASRGIAFVDFTASEEVDKAMKRNGSELNGQAVAMKYEAPRSRPRPDGCMAVAVKKLPPEATEADIHTLFKGLESLTDARVICGKDKACVGLAFAEFSKAADVEAAVRRDGVAVRGRTVFICYETKSRKPRAAPGDGDQSTSAGAPGEKKKGKQKAKKPSGEAAAAAGAAAGGAEEAEREREEQDAPGKKRGKRKAAEKPGGEAAAVAADVAAGEAEEAEREEQDAQPQASQKKKKARRKEEHTDVRGDEEAPEGAEAGEERGAAAEAAAPEPQPRKKRRRAAAAAEDQEPAREEDDEDAAPEAKPRKKRRKKKGE